MSPEASNNPPKIGARKLRQAIYDKLEEVVLWDATDIRFKINKGVVTLTGTVADKEDLQNAEDLVSSIEGVTAVKNNLKIKGPGIASVISEIASQLTRVMTDEEDSGKI